VDPSPAARAHPARRGRGAGRWNLDRLLVDVLAQALRAGRVEQGLGLAPEPGTPDGAAQVAVDPPDLPLGILFPQRGQRLVVRVHQGGTCNSPSCPRGPDDLAGAKITKRRAAPGAC